MMALRFPAIAFQVTLVLMSSVLAAPLIAAENTARVTPATTLPVAPTGTPGVAVPPNLPSLKVWVAVQAGQLNLSRLRTELERELSRDVVIAGDAGEASVRIILESQTRVSVSYTSSSGELLTRSLDLPSNARRSLEIIAWVTGNLVRDESSELLAELRARRSTTGTEAALVDQATPVPAQSSPSTPTQSPPNQPPGRQAKSKSNRKPKAPVQALASSPSRSPRDEAAPETVHLLPRAKYGFDLALATPWSLVPDSPERELSLELALAYADVGALRGAGLAVGALRLRSELEGVGFGVGYARAQGSVRGVLGSALVAQSEGPLVGVEVAGVVSLQRGAARGVLLGGVGVVSGPTIGAIATGLVAIADSNQGVAASGLVLVLKQPSLGFAASGVGIYAAGYQGVLVSGGANIVGDFEGFEVSGLSNVGQRVRGVSISTVNLHSRVDGVQIGLVNISSELHGAAVGVINYAGNGRLQPLLWASSDGAAHAGMKSVTGYSYSQLGAGLRSNQELSIEGGFGAHLPSGQFFLEPGVHYAEVWDTRKATAQQAYSAFYYQLQAGLRLGETADLLVGARLKHVVQGGGRGAISPEAVAGVAFF